MSYTVLSDYNPSVTSYDDDLKNHLRIIGAEEQSLIEAYIRAAWVYIAKYIGYPILSTEIVFLDKACNLKIDLPKTVSTVTTIEIFEDDVWTEVDYTEVLTNYGAFKRLYSKDFKNGFEYRITCENEPCVSSLMKLAAKLLVAEFYENKENRNVNVSVMRPHVNVLLDLETVVL